MADTAAAGEHARLSTLVCSLASELLGRTVGADEDLPAAGATSLDLTRLTARARQQCGRVLTLSEVYRLRTCGAIARQLLLSPRSDAATTVAASDRLNHSQERMWFLHALDPMGSAYHVVDAVRLSGRVDVERLEAAWRVVAARHPTLRTTFTSTEQGPRRRMHTEPLLSIDRVALGDDSTGAMPVLERLAAAPFDLVNGPLLRIVIVSIGDDEVIVGVSGHHVIIDQWGLAALYAEVSAAYQGVPQPMAVMGDHDVVVPPVHQIELDLAHWRARLADVSPTTLPTSRRTLEPSEPVAGMVVRDLRDIRSNVASYAAEVGVAPSALYIAAFAATLARYGTGRDVVFGMPVANRTTPELEAIVTTTVNTVVLRLTVDDDESARDLVGRAHREVVDAIDHSATPYSIVVADRHRDMGNAPLFHVMLNVVNVPFVPLVVEGASSESLPLDRGGAQFDLSVTVDLAATSRLLLDHLRAAVPDAVAERFADHFLAVLDALLSAPNEPVGSISMETDDERARREQARLQTRRPIPAHTLHAAVEAQVDRTPTAVAVRGVDRELTYAELDRLGNALADRLASAGVRPSDLVGVHLDRTTDMVVAVLGVLKAGAAYVPLDPAFPTDRLAFMVADAGIEVVVSSSATVELGVPVRVVQPARVGIDVRHRAAVTQRDLAYVIYTSGSTGRPKGVELEHRSVVNFLESMRRRPGLDADDVVLAITTLSFDISVLEIFLPLVTGASCVVATKDETLSPAALADLIARHGVTCMQATPATFAMLVDRGWHGHPDLLALCGGEALPPELVAALIERCREVWNVYGPTETTVWSAALRMMPGAPIRVGGPLDNTNLLVVDAQGRPTPRGAPGELAIGGDGLARGYHGRPELTAARFVADPEAGIDGARRYLTGDVVREEEDGTLEFLGRTDTQVKVRGHRIELGEIDAALGGIAGVSRAATVVRSLAPGDVRLVAFYTTEPGQHPEPGHLRALLSARLPAYMVPASFVELEAMPLTPNRKIDRGALPPVVPAAIDARHAGEPPRPGLERVIAAIWEAVLDTKGVGRHDDFFALGGHSLLAVQVFARLVNETGIELPLTTLFTAPTIAQLAERATEAKPRTEFTSLIELRASGDRPPWFYVAPFLVTALSFEALGRHLGPDQPVFVLQPQGMEGDHEIHERVEDMAAHYISELRTIQPSGPYHIGGHCAGGWVAFEMARQLVAIGEHVATLLLVDVEPPGVTAPAGSRFVGVVERAAFYARSRRVGAAIRWKIAVLHERAITRRLGSAEQRRVADLRARHMRAHRAYAGGRLAGNAVLVRSAQLHGMRSAAWHLRWGDRLDGELRVRVVPGAHSALVSEESSAALAAIIRTEMDAAISG